MAISNEDIVRELKRELKVRLRVYPRWVSMDRLRKYDMDHRIACLEAALEIFEERAQAQGQLLL